MENNDAAMCAEDKRQELSLLLSRYAQQINQETHEWAEQVRKEAREQAKREASVILARVEEESRVLMEKTRAEAVATAQKEAEAIKSQARKEVEGWLIEMRKALAHQLKEMSSTLHRELLSQTDAIRQRASAFEADFSRQLEETLRRETDFHELVETTPSTLSVTQEQAPGRGIADATIDRWIELKVAAPFTFGILQVVKTRLEQIPELVTSDITTIGSNTSIHVFLKKPVNLDKALSSLPEVRRVEEVTEKGERKLKITLVDKLGAREPEGAKNQRHSAARPVGNEVVLKWQQ